MGWTGPGEADSYFWKLLNRNKLSITLDLKSESGRASLRALLAEADVLIENMRPGKLEALGFGCDDLLRANPRLVILRVSGFGQDGPYAQHPGFATIAEALSGFSALLGEPEGGPLLPPIALTDEVTALVGAFSILAALRHAEKTGEGQVIDVSLLDSMFQIMGPLVSAFAHLGYIQPRLGSGIPYTVPRGTYRCADGKWVAISASADSVAARLLELVGLTGDGRFASFQDRTANREALEQHLRDWVVGPADGRGHPRIPPRRRGGRAGVRHERRLPRRAFQGAGDDHRGRGGGDAERRGAAVEDAGRDPASRAGVRGGYGGGAGAAG